MGNNPEENNVIFKTKKLELKENLQCHLDNTDPNGEPIFDVCGAEPPETLAPESCADFGLDAFIDDVPYSCAEIVEDDLCSDKEVWGHCRESCKKCKKCRDSKAKFTVTLPGTNKERERSCKYVKNNIELCDEEDIFHACGKTCGACS